MKKTTPIRRQYLKIKSKHKDSILLFRLGDFYEAFDEDARLVARELDIALTTKPMGKDLRVPLAGIPHYALEKHLATLISRGHRVAICEQTSSAPIKGDDGKKLIKREVTRIVTAGTVIEPQLLDSKTNNYLVSFCSDGERAGIAYADISTGEFAATEMSNAVALSEISRIGPSELLIAASDNAIGTDELPKIVTRLDKRYFEPKRAGKAIREHFGAGTMRPFGLDQKPLAVSAAGALLAYLKDVQVGEAAHMTRLTSYDSGNYMFLDRRTFKALEIFQSETDSSLFSIIDRTATPMGGRLLRRWLRQPSLDTAEIYGRQEHVAWFLDNASERERLSELLEQMVDLERFAGRARANYITAFEVRGLGRSLELLPRIRKILQNDPVRFGSLLEKLPLCEEVAGYIDRGIADEPPSQFSEQVGIIREGFSEELDELRRKLRDGRGFLSKLEKRERKRTGIKSLRVGFNKVFGYYIEVTKPNLHLVPEDYTRKQTLIPSERFVTLELKEYESMVIHARERIAELENNLFRQICAEIAGNHQEIVTAARTVAFLDAVRALAETAFELNFTRPAVNDSTLLRIRAGRHPGVEKNLAEADRKFVANDSDLGGEKAPRIALITGPNASGKSTYLRQVALIVILAQIGSYVPAGEASIGICDRIFTRIGLYDRIGSGESTFMTEMIETAEILHHATGKSLILLDELGRGTSTYDGLSVARAVLEFLHNHPQTRARTLFATHYHELAALEELLPGVGNLHFRIEEDGRDIRFKYELAPGTALKSYGVYAARIAGLPKPVVRRAEELLRHYEEEPQGRTGSQTDDARSEVERALAGIDTDAISPVEALMKLYELKKMLERSDTADAPNRLKKSAG